MPKPEFIPPIPNNSWGQQAARDAELQWLIDNPAFDERPATMLEFLGPRYLDIDADQNPELGTHGVIRPGVKQALLDIFGAEINPESLSAHREAMFTGGIGVGKQLANNVDVLTPSGWRKHGDLVPGDYVIGKNGKATQVTAVFPHRDIQMYRITFKDGTSIEAGDEHLWEVHESVTVGVKQPNGKYTTRRELRRLVVSTEWLYGQELTKGTAYRFRIPLVDPVQYSVTPDLPVDPYTLGWFLANGSLHTGTPRLACHEDDREELLELIEIPGIEASWDQMPGKHGGSWILRNAAGGLRRRDSNPLTVALRSAGIYDLYAVEKFVPDGYLLASPDQRLELLRGLMDGDGSSYAKNRQVFSTSSSRLAGHVADLVRSLGGYCTITELARRDAIEYQVHVNLDDVCPFRLSRKVANWRPRTNQRPARSIVSVEKLGRADAQCIKVDAPDELYVVKDYIVTHNTTMASVALAYMVHWVCCLHDPQKYFGLMQGSRIAFMLMSTKDSQAKEVLFGDIKARINHSPWFRKNCLYDPRLKNQLRFPKDVWVIPGNSAETTFEGYNILGGILDEGDSHKQTEEKDYAEVGYRTILARITSRFTNPITGKHRGLLITIGQMKSAEGFMAKTKRRLEAANARSEAAGKSVDNVVVVMTIWDSFGWESYRDPATGEVASFFYDPDRRRIVPPAVARSMGSETNIIEIPESYRKDFELDPVQALKDHAGIPPNVDDPFIVTPDRIDEAQQKWAVRYPGFVPVPARSDRMELHELLHAHEWESGAVRRAVHIDIGYSATGDAAALVMGHIPELIKIDGELKPVIVFDFLLRVKARSGSALMLRDFRRLVRELRDDRKFRIGIVTYDGFQSVDSIQLLREARFNADELSVDRNKGPYEDLREAIYERRIEFPQYMTYLNRNDTDTVNIARRELLSLKDTGRKIDHPPKGSKDLADGMAAVVHALMRGPGFRRGARRAVEPNRDDYDTDGMPGIHVYGDTVDVTGQPLSSDVLAGFAVGNEIGPRGIRGRSPGYGLPPLEADPFGALRRISPP